MRAKVPTNADASLLEFGKRLTDELDAEFRKRTPDLNARSNLLLAAPDGSIWAVTVDNAGALATSKVSDG